MIKIGNKPITASLLKKGFENSSFLTLGLIAIFVIYLFWNLPQPHQDFYNELWGPVHLLIQAKSPYDTTSLGPTLPAVWFPMALGFFFPLGWLPESVAFRIWCILNVIEICAIVYFLQGNKRSWHGTAVLAFSCFIFPFTVFHFMLGQFSITLMLCLLLAAYFADSQRDWATAFFIALALSKPQFGIIGALGLSIYYFQRKGIREVFYFGLRIFLMSFVLSLPLFVYFPTWIFDCIKSMLSNPMESYLHIQPSLFIILKQNILGRVVYGAMLIGGLYIIYQLWIKLPSHIAMLWSLGVATIITPYVWNWDYVLLLPIWIYVFAQAGWKGKSYLLFFYVIFLGGVLFVYTQAAVTIHYNQSLWAAPVIFMGVLAIFANNFQNSKSNKNLT